MRAARRASVALICILVIVPFVMAAPSPEESELGDSLNRAANLIRLGVVEKGAGRSFEDAAELLQTVQGQLVALQPSSEEGLKLTLEYQALQQDLEVITELYEERFYGVFPLARLTIPTLLADGGFAVTEQLFHPPDVAAVEVATRKFLANIDAYHHPHIVIRSLSEDPGLEYLVWDSLVRDGGTTPHTRRDLINILNTEELEAFDLHGPDQQLVERLLKAFDTVTLMVLTVSEPVKLDDAHVNSLRREFFSPGEVIQGSAVGATPVLRCESSTYLGFARDRRAQHWPIICTQGLLFALALAWATQIQWRIGNSLTIFQRSLVGATLFVFGRVYAVLTVVVLRKTIPESSALAVSAWWWPAVLGMLIVLGGGLAAWIAQAQLTNIVPGERGERAVGSIFALAAVGASSYFVAPLLLLEGTRGFASFVPLFLAAVTLALLFGFAARTGPPVPNYFAIGPLVLALVLGVCLLAVSPALLWMIVGCAAALCVAAWVRHRYAVAHGTEEPEPSPEEASQADQEKLAKLTEKLKR